MICAGKLTISSELFTTEITGYSVYLLIPCYPVFLSGAIILGCLIPSYNTRYKSSNKTLCTGSTCNIIGISCLNS